MCHPIYTGKKQTDRHGGRIDRFKKRADATAAATAKKA
jgi:ribosomal protein L31